MAAALLHFVLLSLTAVAAAEHPIEGVIKLLGELKAKAEDEGFKEEQAYGKYEYWCKESLSTVEAAIASENEKIESLTLEIDGLSKEKTVLEEQISKLNDTIVGLQTSSKEAKDLRDGQASDYSTASGDLEKTIKAVKDALEFLQASEKRTESSLVQEQARKIIAVMQASNESIPADLKVMGDKDKHVDKYDFKSDNVIELLKSLKAKFEDDLTRATEEETNSLNSYTLAQKARDNSESAASKAKGQKTTTLGEVEKDLGTAKTNKLSEEADLKADTATRDGTKSACERKAAEWDERSKTRTNEIKAITAAVDILSKVSGVRHEASVNPKLGKSPLDAFLLQVATEQEPTKAKGVELIRAAAKKYKSRELDRLAVEVSNHLSGPFDVVNNMIQKMIFHLQKEQKDEDKHKDWCDLELEKTSKHQSDRDDSIKLLNAKITELEANINTLTREIGEANDMIGKLNEFMQESTEIREAGKMENSISLKDAMDAQTALANAISVLEAHYKESGAIKESLLQDPVSLPSNPDTWESGYTGVADPKDQPKGIIAVLEATAADFSEMEAQTKAQEETDQKDYQETMKRSKIALAERTQEVKEKEDQKMETVRELDSTKAKKKRTDDELEQWNTYMTNLQPACVEGSSTYVERKQARTDEIAALRQAQTTLANYKSEGALVQKSPVAFLEVRRHMPSN